MQYNGWHLAFHEQGPYVVLSWVFMAQAQTRDYNSKWIGQSLVWAQAKASRLFFPTNAYTVSAYIV